MLLIRLRAKLKNKNLVQRKMYMYVKHIHPLINLFCSFEHFFCRLLFLQIYAHHTVYSVCIFFLCLSTFTDGQFYMPIIDELYHSVAQCVSAHSKPVDQMKMVFVRLGSTNLVHVSHDQRRKNIVFKVKLAAQE